MLVSLLVSLHFHTIEKKLYLLIYLTTTGRIAYQHLHESYGVAYYAHSSMELFSKFGSKELKIFTVQTHFFGTIYFRAFPLFSKYIYFNTKSVKNCKELCTTRVKSIGLLLTEPAS